jgi:hypothetical protein
MKNKHSTLTTPQALAVLSMFILLVAWTTVGQSQEANSPSAGASKQTQGAVSTGGAHAAVLDTEKRPITAGGFVESGLVVFQEVAEKAGLFEVVSPVKGTGLAALLTARGAAFGDLFNDGKIDVVINQLHNVPALLRNVYPTENHGVGLRLIGGPKSPRDAVGATVYLVAGGSRQRGDVTSGVWLCYRVAADSATDINVGRMSPRPLLPRWPKEKYNLLYK